MSKVSTAYTDAKDIADYIVKQLKVSPEIGIICGSGLGKFAESVEDLVMLSYENIPGFPRSTVEGHEGNLVFGKIGGRDVVVMQGRFHMYEGYDKLTILGVRTILMSNAVGALNRSFKLGDFVVLKDHISFPSISLHNVLVGPNISEFGPRFPSITHAYDSELRKLALEVAKEQEMESVVHQGVYAHCGGPAYETPAECKMLLMMGADVVGMSTAPEVIIARHCGIRVFAVSLVTNISVMDVENKTSPCHEEVLKIGRQRSESLQQWFKAFIPRIPR